MERQETLESLASRPPTVVVIGGGINGIGTFRDLVFQGVDTLLVDRGDFCSGASAASSRMAHGGIRYLENGEFNLVREAVQERNRMLLNAPSFVQPLPTTIPIFKFFSGLWNAPLKFLGWLEKPSERGAIIIKMGLIFYDAFTGKRRIVPRHIFHGRRRSLELFPEFNPRVVFTATYYDGLILSPERLALEQLLEAENEGIFGRALNYVSFHGMRKNTVMLKDEITGKIIDLKPRVIVNATGPWIDSTNSMLGLSTAYIDPTKGSHLVLENPSLRSAIRDHEIFFENKDGRIVLIFPLFDKVLIGTSDLPIIDPDSARCTEQEVEYFLGMVKHVFPGIEISRDDIIFRFSGVRPLARTNARLPGQITRDHHIKVDSINNLLVFSLVGGKWTSFRAFSAQVVDQVLSFLELPRKVDTSSRPIGVGAPALKSLPDYSRQEIIDIAKREKIIHLDDLLLRRTLLAYLGQLSLPFVVQFAGWLAESLGWDENRKNDEVTRCLDILADRHGVVLGKFPNN